MASTYDSRPYQAGPLTPPPSTTPTLHSPSTPSFHTSDGNYTDVYRPLSSSTEIRLLQLFPRSPEAPNRIQCRLLHTDVAQRSVDLYAAVSYTWGRYTQRDLIWVEGKILEVRRNVKQLLHELRDNAPDGQPRLLWIDAVCINQSDAAILERNSQVRLMGEIYRKANYVLVWLEQPHGQAPISEALRLLVQAPRTKDYPVSQLTQRHVQSFRWLFGNEYWQRRWIIQEIALARAVDIVSGGYQIPLSDFFSAVSKVYNFEKDTFYTCLQQIGLLHGMRSPAHLLLLSQRKSHPDVQLRELLYKYRESQCLNPRDKIFALLALCKTAHEVIPVDYSMEPIMLMLFVLDFCLFHEELDLLSTIGLGLLLRSQLEIETATLNFCLRHDLLSVRYRATSRTQYNLRAIVRGRVVSSDVNNHWRSYVLHCRSALRQLPPLAQCRTAPLIVSGSGNAFRLQLDDLISELDVSLCSTAVGYQDLCAFMYRAELEDSNFRIGLASTRVQLDDQIWQFPKTDLALVARRTKAGGFEIVGRTYLLRRKGAFGYPSTYEEVWQVSPSEMLDFADEEMAGNSSDEVRLRGPQRPMSQTQDLIVDVPGFIALVKWVGFG
jgi:hypothetical protein